MIEQIDGSSATVLMGNLLSQGQPVNIELQVRADGVRLFVENQYVYGWFGESARLSPPRWFGFPENVSNRLRLATLENPVLIKKLILRPVEVEGRLDAAALLAKLKEINPGLADAKLVIPVLSPLDRRKF